MLPLIFVLAIRDCDSESEEMIIEGPTVIYPVKIVCLIFFNYQWIFLLCPFPLKQSYVRYVLHVKCMYHISDITDFALWPILLSSAIFWWVWGNPTNHDISIHMTFIGDAGAPLWSKGHCHVISQRWGWWEWGNNLCTIGAYSWPGDDWSTILCGEKAFYLDLCSVPSCGCLSIFFFILLSFFGRGSPLLNGEILKRWTT